MSGPGAGVDLLAAPPARPTSAAVRRRTCASGTRPIPSLALRVFVDGRGGCQVAAYEGVRAGLDREPLTAPAQWQPGQQIAVGSSLLGLAPYQPPDAALHPSADGAGIDFNRPPRLLPPERVTRFQLPAPPSEAERRPLPDPDGRRPAGAGRGHGRTSCTRCTCWPWRALSPVMLIGSHLSERRHGRKTAARQAAAYREHKARIERDAREALEAERAERAAQFPDPATVLSIAAGPRRRLWERRRTDPDYLVLRVGTADLPSSVELTDPEQDEHRRQVDLARPRRPGHDLTARAGRGRASPGPGDTPRAAGRWLVAQAAALHSPERPADLPAHRLLGPGELGVGALAAALPAAGRAGLRHADRQRRGVGRHQDRRTARHRQRPAAGGCAGSGSSEARFRPGHRGGLRRVTQAAVAARRRSSCCGRARTPGSTRSAWTPRSSCCPPSARPSS